MVDMRYSIFEFCFVQFPDKHWILQLCARAFNMSNLVTSSKFAEYCVCGNDLNGAINCDSETGNVHLAQSFCIFFSEVINTTLTGTCP